jgi:hypothetical protein
MQPPFGLNFIFRYAYARHCQTHCRGKPLVFSLEPRCQARGLQMPPTALRGIGDHVGEAIDVRRSASSDRSLFLRALQQNGRLFTFLQILSLWKGL